MNELPFVRDPEPQRTYPCGRYDESKGNLWSLVNHAYYCQSPACWKWLEWFENFRAVWIARHRRPFDVW